MKSLITNFFKPPPKAGRPRGTVEQRGRPPTVHAAEAVIGATVTAAPVAACTPETAVTTAVPETPDAEHALDATATVFLVAPLGEETELSEDEEESAGNVKGKRTNWRRSSFVVLILFMFQIWFH